MYSEIMKWLWKNTNPLKIYLCYTQAQNYFDLKHFLYAFSNTYISVSENAELTELFTFQI